MIPKNIINTNKGVVLFIVLSIILVVVALANVILVLIASQSRLTQHQVGRIQASYAAQAGMNYAIEMLRTGGWSPPTTTPITYTMCRSGCNVTENSFPQFLQVNITVSPLATTGTYNGTYPLNVTVNYPTPQ